MQFLSFRLKSWFALALRLKSSVSVKLLVFVSTPFCLFGFFCLRLQTRFRFNSLLFARSPCTQLKPVCVWNPVFVSTLSFFFDLPRLRLKSCFRYKCFFRLKSLLFASNPLFALEVLISFLKSVLFVRPPLFARVILFLFHLALFFWTSVPVIRNAKQVLSFRLKPCFPCNFLFGFFCLHLQFRFRFNSFLFARSPCTQLKPFVWTLFAFEILFSFQLCPFFLTSLVCAWSLAFVTSVFFVWSLCFSLQTLCLLLKSWFRFSSLSFLLDLPCLRVNSWIFLLNQCPCN